MDSLIDISKYYGVDFFFFCEISSPIFSSSVVSYCDFSFTALDSCVNKRVTHLLDSLHAPHLLHTPAIGDIKKELLYHLSRQEVDFANQKILNFINFIYQNQDVVYKSV
jgi:hypothetical protein